MASLKAGNPLPVFTNSSPVSIKKICNLLKFIDKSGAA